MTGRISLLALLALAFGCAPAGGWALVQVGPHERSLEIKYHSGACETSAVHGDEGRRAIFISVTHKRDPGEYQCPEILYTTTVHIRLSRPLAGRHVLGGESPRHFEGPFAGPKEARYPVVPRLIGLAPEDAKFLLDGLGLRAGIGAWGRLREPPRVISQSPAAGVRVPKSKLVVVRVG